MKEYLRTIHERTPSHRNRFALLVSGGTTLLIFGVWSLVVFGGQTAVLAEAPTPKVEEVEAESPFGGLSGGVANSFSAIKEQFQQIKESVSNINIETEYEEVRNEALSN
jgi:hypothetical protein